MAFCPNCGTPNTDQAEKCAACGFELIVPKQKAKFKGTIMMSGIKAPTPGEAAGSKAGEDEGVGDQPTEPPPKPATSLPPPAAAAKPATDTGRNPNYAKTMMGHAPIMAPAKPAESAPTPAPETTPAARPSDPVVEASTPSTPSFEAPASPAPSSPQIKQVTIDEDSPPPAAASSSWSGTGPSRPQARVGGYDSTVPPSAPPATPKPGKIIALGCGVALALFCVVGSVLYYVVGPKVRSMMGSDDSNAEAAAWQASIVQSLAQVSELCKVDCAQAGVYFHPLKEASLLGEARLLTPERLQKLSDSSKTAATMLNGTDDEDAATKLGLDPQQCARVTAGSAKVISCSVPDPGGKPSVLRIVDLAGVGTL